MNLSRRRLKSTERYIGTYSAECPRLSINFHPWSFSSTSQYQKIALEDPEIGFKHITLKKSINHISKYIFNASTSYFCFIPVCFLLAIQYLTDSWGYNRIHTSTRDKSLKMNVIHDWSSNSLTAISQSGTLTTWPERLAPIFLGLVLF